MCWTTSAVVRSGWKKSSMLVNRSTTTYRLSVLTRQIAYARRNATNSIRSRIVKRARGSESRVRRQEPGIRGESFLVGLVAPDRRLLAPGPGVVQVKILVDVVVGRGRLAVAVAARPELTDGVGNGPPLVLHTVDGGQ